MSTFAYWLVVPPPPAPLAEGISPPFHVCERSGFSPDRADYLSRQAKLNFTSLERHHKASLSGSPPRSPNEPTPTHTHPRTHTEKQRAFLTDIRRRKPVTCRCHPNRLLSGAMRPPLKSSNEDTRVNVRPRKCQHLGNEAGSDTPRTQIRPRTSASVTLFYLVGSRIKKNLQRPGCRGAFWVKIRMADFQSITYLRDFSWFSFL